MSASATSRTESEYFAWGPFIWVAGLHAGALFAFSPAYFTWRALVVCLFLMWLTGGIGICLTYHRLLTHRSFEIRPRWLEYVLTALGCCASQGGAVGWVADHRKHHALADLEEDVHSPRRSLAWAYTVWWMTPGVTASRHTTYPGFSGEASSGLSSSCIRHGWSIPQPTSGVTAPTRRETTRRISGGSRY
jgi:fatty-acid desaturase